MKRRKSKIKMIAVLFSFLLIFFLFYIFINDRQKNIFFINNINDLSANILNITSISFLKDNKNYNKEIKSEINNDYKSEINKLKQTLKLNIVNSDKKIVNATVIKRSMNYWYNIISIDKGKKDNIKVGNAVINNFGLVGKVINVNNNTSDIKLLTSQKNDNYISAKFLYKNKEYYGLLENYDIKKNELKLENVIGDFNKNDITNNNVVTSGLSDSFSSGLLIGKIVNINKENYGISNTIIIKPTVNFDNLDIVSVVIGDK